MKKAILGLAVCAALIFWGRAYHYYFWDGPWRVLLWDQALFGPVVEGLLGMSWADYVTDVGMDQRLTRLNKGLAALFVLAGAAALFLPRLKRWWLAIPLWLGSGILVIHALLEMKGHFYHLAQFFEYSIQFATPLLLTWAVLKKPAAHTLLLGLKIVVAATFVAHGLYAIGAYPVPGHFVDMTINILGLSEAAARNLLYLAGALDLVVGLALFIPRFQGAALVYTLIWGLLTALARVVSGFDAYFPVDSLHASLYGTVYRLPHGLLSWVGILLLRQQTRNSDSDTD